MNLLFVFCVIIYSNLFIPCENKAVSSALKVSNPLVSLPCDFENGLCPGYEVDRTADFEWMLMTGPTSSLNTGPNGDNTPGLNGKGYYVYIESTKKLNRLEARIQSSPLDHNKTSGQKLCLQFFYHMRGHTIGEFNVGVVTLNDNLETIHYRVSGNQHHTKWQKGQFSFSTPNQPYKLVFRGITSYGYHGDIGLDDIHVSLTKDGACDFWPTNVTSSQQIQSTPSTPPIHLGPEDQKTCGRLKIQTGRILSGRPVRPQGKWPWMAMLERISGNEFEHFCGGTLLSNKWIITAAHCVVAMTSTSRMRIRLGSISRKSIDPNTQVIDVKNIYVHPEYNTKTNFNKDIALIELKRPAIINTIVESICLNTAAKDLENSASHCVATGWGLLWEKMQGFEKEYAKLLAEAKFRIKERKDCINNHANKLITDYMLCAKGDNDYTDTCEGDSGGPLMCQNKDDGSWALVGISSWGSKEGCDDTRHYGVFTRMSMLNKWVIETTANPHLAKTLH